MYFMFPFSYNFLFLIVFQLFSILSKEKKKDLLLLFPNVPAMRTQDENVYTICPRCQR